MVVGLLEIDPRAIALLCRLADSDIPRIKLDISEIDMMIELEDRGLVTEKGSLRSFTLTPKGQELAVKASIVMRDLPESPSANI